MSAGGLVRFVERAGTDSLKWRRFDADAIPAWVADMDFAAAPAIIDALRARAQDGVFGYGWAEPVLAETITRYFYRRWRWRVEAEWLVYSPGLGAAIHNVCRLADTARPGVITPAPIYHVFRHAPEYAGRERLDAPMVCAGGEWTLPMETLAAMPDCAGVFQLCNPHNPNGKVFRRDELEAIAEFCLRRDLIICADEVHADLILDGDKTHIPIASLSPEIAARTITMQSPSKAFNIAGLNFAVVVIPDAALRARYRAAARGKVITNLNPFGFVAAAAAWGGACDAWLADAVAVLRANRDMLAAAVADTDGITMPPLPATYLAWLNVEGLRLPDAPRHFLKHGLAMSPGGDFGDARYMRLNFGCSPARLREIIERLQAAACAA